MSNPRYQKSLELWQNSKKNTVPASALIAKDPHLFTYGAYPIYLKEGKGAVVKDIDNNTYIDFQSSLGPTILGHSFAPVNQAIISQLKKGILFSGLNPLSTKLAEIICSIVPCAEQIRLFKTGADTTAGAVRIARAYTQKTKIISCHFHGWHDWFYVTTSLPSGIPISLKNDIEEFEYNNLQSLEEIFKKNPGQIAAVIMEPAHLEKPEAGFLQKIKELTHKNNALLIFDEVVTGFRFSLGGGQEYFKVTPDLCCFSKAIANGMPLGVVAGKKEIMEKTVDVITSTTFSEEVLSLAAAIATLETLQKKPVIAHIWQLGEYFQNRYNALAKKYDIPFKCIGYPCRLELTFQDYKAIDRLMLKAFFLQESAKRNILLGNAIFLNYSHTKKQVETALKVCEEIFQSISETKNIILEGERTKELW